MGHAAPSWFSGYQSYLAAGVDLDVVASGAEQKDVTLEDLAATSSIDVVAADAGGVGHMVKGQLEEA